MGYEIKKILSLVDKKPRNLRGKVSFGNWAVDYIIPSRLGSTGTYKMSEYFWRKADALKWIESDPKTIKLVSYSNNI